MFRSRLDFAPETRSTSGTRLCDVPGCRETTREGKPYCPDHVEMNPYVQQLLSMLSTQEEERDRASQAKARNRSTKIDLNGENVQAILRELKAYGERTFERLARDTQIPVDVVEQICKALKRKKLVVLGKTKRNSQTARLPDQEASTGRNLDVETPAADPDQDLIDETQTQKESA